MSKYFDHVVGLDYSRAFIQLAEEVKASGAAAFNNKRPKVPYCAPVQGELTESREVSAPRNTFPERCAFVVGDAMHLFPEDPDVAPGSYTVPDGASFDGVLCVNLLDRVPDPMVVLRSFARLLQRRGVLVLCDPYSWTETATPKSKWLGAVPEGSDSGNAFAGRRSEDVVKEVLSADFELQTETEEPFLIRDHVRHYQLGFSHCTVWIRK
ncbi:hypothetical protein STCU_04817 [Strigomonas culicis]|uniref:Methyltransferase type 11 domain-containing protein n=1 Tax=Strigomonas culicis TaxID=28005 RepID=S9VPD5_9TRYP|nr:hypothetical protein STCU_04817 [Strigomonas culicis]|eukprot:EPY28916.1 hypothetical protein STCU_04817 [Strigomonas culicis]